jgi:co-chaperonin GroES (HSP10)
VPASSDKRDRVQGIVLACGPGEYLYDGRFVSMEFDDDIMVGDVIYIERNTGLEFGVDQIDYRVVTPNEVIGKLRRNLGHSTAEKLQAALRRATSKHQEKGDSVGQDTRISDTPEISLRRPYEKDSRDVREEIRSAKGKKTKTQILVPPGAPVGPEKGG